MTGLEILWNECWKEFPGDFRLVRKLSMKTRKIRSQNYSVYGNQGQKLKDLQSQIQNLEVLGENRALSYSKSKKLYRLITEQWEVSKNMKAIYMEA